MAIKTTFLSNSSEDNNLSTNPIGYFVPVSVNDNTVTIKDKNSISKTLTYDTLNNQLIEDSSGEIFVVLKETLNSYYEISDITINGEEWNVNMVVDKLDDSTDHDYTHLLLFISDVIESEVNVDSVVGYVVDDERFKYGNNVSFSNTLIQYDNSYPYLLIELNTSVTFTKELNYEFEYNVKMTEDSDVSVVHVSDQRESSIKEFTELYTYNALNDMWLYINKFIKDTQYNVNSTTISESGGISIYEDNILVYGQVNPNGISFDFYSNIYGEDSLKIIYKEETKFDSYNINKFGTKKDSNYIFSFDEQKKISPYIEINLDTDNNIINFFPYEDRNNMNTKKITGFNFNFGEITDNDIYDRKGYIKSKYTTFDESYFDGIEIHGIESLLFNNSYNVCGDEANYNGVLYYSTWDNKYPDGFRLYTFDDKTDKDVKTYKDTSLNLGFNKDNNSCGFNTIKSDVDGIFLKCSINVYGDIHGTNIYVNGGISTSTITASGLITATGGISSSTITATGLITATGGIQASSGINVDGTITASNTITALTDIIIGNITSSSYGKLSSDGSFSGSHIFLSYTSGVVGDSGYIQFKNNGQDKLKIYLDSNGQLVFTNPMDNGDLYRFEVEKL